MKTKGDAMTCRWKQVEKRHTILIGGYCVILHEEEWTLGENSGVFVARCSGVSPDPFRIMERCLEKAKISALRTILSLVDTQVFNLNSFSDNLAKILEG